MNVHRVMAGCVSWPIPDLDCHPCAKQGPTHPSEWRRDVSRVRPGMTAGGWDGMCRLASRPEGPSQAVEDTRLRHGADRLTPAAFPTIRRPIARWGNLRALLVWLKPLSEAAADVLSADERKSAGEAVPAAPQGATTRDPGTSPRKDYDVCSDQNRWQAVQGCRQ